LTHLRGHTLGGAAGGEGRIGFAVQLDIRQDVVTVGLTIEGQECRRLTGFHMPFSPARPLYLQI
jgi:hypothetical protein